MTFTFTNYARMETPKSPLQALISNALNTYTGVTKARYLQPNLEEALKKAKLFNQYYGPEKESEIGLRGAQTSESGARTGLLGEQTKGQHITNEFLPQKLRNAIQQSVLQQQLMNQVMGGMGGMGNPTQQGGQPHPGMYTSSPPPDMGGNSFPQGQGPLMQGQQPQQSENQPSMAQGGLTYPQAALAMQLMHLGKPQVENINGKYVALTPFGNIDVAQGPTKLQEALFKEDAKKISGLEDIALSGDKKLTTLHELGDTLSSPQFEEMRQNAILGKHELGYYAKFGTKAQQRFVGNFMTQSGEIIKDFANEFKGQFRKGEQELLENTKATDSDSLDVMKGKTEALTFLVQALSDRSRMEAELMRERGISALQARKEVNNVFNPAGIKEEIKARLKSKGRPSKEGVLAEIEKRKNEGRL